MNCNMVTATSGELMPRGRQTCTKEAFTLQIHAVNAELPAGEFVLDNDNGARMLCCILMQAEMFQKRPAASETPRCPHQRTSL